MMIYRLISPKLINWCLPFMILNCVVAQNNYKTEKAGECSHESVVQNVMLWFRVSEKLCDSFHISPENSRRFLQFIKQKKLIREELMVSEPDLSLSCLQLFSSLHQSPEYIHFQNLKHALNTIPVLQGGNNCNNLDFSNGTVNGWTGTWNSTGFKDLSNNNFGLNSTIGLNTGSYNTLNTVHQLCTPGLDRIVPINRVPPNHQYSMRLGSDSASTEEKIGAANHQTASNTFLVTQQNCILTFWYAIVFTQTGVEPNTGPHAAKDQPYFKLKVMSGSSEINCAKYDINCTQAAPLPQASPPGWKIQNRNSPHNKDLAYQAVYKDWAPILIPLSSYIGQTVTITFETSDCNAMRHCGYCYFAIDCELPSLNIGSFLCQGGTTTISAPPGGTNYQWSGPGIIGSSTGASININKPGQYTATITTIGANGSSCSFSLSTQVSLQSTSVASFTATTACKNTSTMFTNTSNSLTNWQWNFGDGYSDNVNANPSHLYANAGTYTVSLTGINQYGCKDSIKQSVLVKPLPALSTILDDEVCAGSTVSPVNFLSVPAGATVSWVNSNPAIGLPASGSGNISSYTAPNTNTLINATIIGTPVLNGCTGSSNSFQISIKPLPQLNTLSNQVVCSNSLVGPINFSSTIAGASINWTNDNTATGIAASGTGNITAFTTPVSFTPLVSNITVAPIFNGCTGIASTFSILVNPQPLIQNIADQSVCSGSPINPVVFSTNPSGSNFTWTNTNPSIGLASSGTGNISAYNSPNLSNTETGIITVTPSLAGCAGAPISFTITVKPLPAIHPVNNQSVCSGAPVLPVNFQSNLPGTTLNWTNSNAAIGLPLSGTGNIPAYTAPSVSSIETGTILVSPVLNGCTGIASSFSILVKPLPLLQNIADQAVCSGSPINPVVFSTNPSGSNFTWTNTNPSIGLTASGVGNISAYNSPSLSNTETGSITVTPTLAGCVGTPISFSITVKPLPAINPLSNQSVCSGAQVLPVNFQSNPPGATFNWTNSNAAIGLPLSGTGNIPAYTAPSVSAIETGTILVSPILNGCSGSAIAVSISIKPTPVVNSPVNTTLCGGTVFGGVNFMVSPVGAGINWVNSNPAIGLAVSGSGNISACTTPTTTILQTAVITMHPILNGCTGSPGSFSITVNANPQISGVPDTDTAFCEKVTGGISGLVVIGGTPPYQYQWYNGNTPIPGANQSALTNVGAGTYQLVVKDFNNCLATGATNIFTIPSASTVIANFNASTLQGPEPLLVNFINTSSGANNYNWSINNSYFNTQANIEHTFIQSGTYTVTLIASNGKCTDTISKIITVDIVSYVIIPNIFSPNHDHVNDSFFISSRGLKVLNCSIFNRWGQNIYNIDSPNDEWDGKYSNGIEASDGTYYYFVKALGVDGKQYDLKGTLMLVR